MALCITPNRWAIPRDFSVVCRDAFFYGDRRARASVYNASRPRTRPLRPGNRMLQQVQTCTVLQICICFFFMQICKVICKEMEKGEEPDGQDGRAKTDVLISGDTHGGNASPMHESKCGDAVGNPEVQWGCVRIARISPHAPLDCSMSGCRLICESTAAISSTGGCCWRR